MNCNLSLLIVITNLRKLRQEKLMSLQPRKIELSLKNYENTNQKRVNCNGG